MRYKYKDAMIKVLIKILLFSCLIHWTCRADDAHEELMKVNCEFKVCIIYKYFYNMNGTIDSLSRKKDFSVVFDDKGKVIKQFFYNPYDSTSTSCIFNYDTTGKILDKMYYGNYGEFVKYEVYLYGHKNLVSEILTYFKYQEVSQIVSFKYNQFGNKIEKHQQSEFFDRRYIYKYDQDTNLIEETELCVDSSISYICHYKYDTKGLVIEKRCDYNISSENYIYRYDANSNLIEAICFNKFNKPIRKYEYIYSK